MALSPGGRLGAYELQEPLGAGGRGVVCGPTIVVVENWFAEFRDQK